MNCNECFEAFSSALDGELNPDEQAAMTEHLEGCQDCRTLQTKMLALSADLKAQPFPQIPEERVKRLTERALESAQASRLGFLRRLLRLPYENWMLRASLRTVSFSLLALFTFLTSIHSHLLPTYEGAEAAAKSGLPDLAMWLRFHPSQTTLTITAVLTLIVGLWVAGLPGFLLDLWTEAKLTQKDLLRLGLGSLFLGPIAALPLVARLELGSYITTCAIWAGSCLVLTYLIISFKTPRPLPRLALDFVGLVFIVGALEWTARASQNLPSPADLQVLIALFVGSVPFAQIALALFAVALCFTTLFLGLTSALPSYRAGGGRLLAIFFFVIAGGAATLSFNTLNPLSVAEPVKAEFVGERQAYILGSSRDNTWVLSAVEYPKLEVNVVGSKVAPRAARLRLASTYLNWNDKALLKNLTEWAAQAPGITWGLSSFVDQLGDREQNRLSVATEERMEAVQSLLGALRWRILDKVELADEGSTVKGRLLGVLGRPEDAPLRLVRLEPEESVNQLASRLTAELEAVKTVVESDSLGADLGLSGLRTVLPNDNGEFLFPRMKPGRYALCLLLSEPQRLTLNPTIPGIFEVTAGEETDLGEIRLSAGSEGADIELTVERWKATGSVAFSVNSEIHSARLESSSSITGFVESEIFSGGRGRLKVLTESEPDVKGSLRALYYTKSGRLVKEWKLDLSGAGGPRELLVDGGKEPGYLQLVIAGESGRLILNSLKLESL